MTISWRNVAWMLLVLWLVTAGEYNDGSLAGVLRVLMPGSLLMWLGR